MMRDSIRTFRTMTVGERNRFWAARRGVARQNKGDFSLTTFLLVLIGAGVVTGLAVFVYLRWLGPSDPPTDTLG
jgi:hypothetical protein